MSLRVCDTGSLAATLGAAPGGGGASGGDPRCCWAAVWRGPTNDLCRVRRAGEGPAGERRVRADYPRGSGRARAAMQAEEVTQELRVLWARRARCAMESERNKELLWHLGKRQQQLQEALELVEVESSVVAQRLHQNRQELQQLEGLVARAKEQAEVARRTAAARREEAEEADRPQGKAEAGAAVPELTKAAEAPGTDGGTSRGSVPGCTRMASSKQALQRSEEILWELCDSTEQLSSKEKKLFAHVEAWLQEDNEKKVVPKGLGKRGGCPRALGWGVAEGRSSFSVSDPSFSQMLRREIKQLEEALEEEEAWQRQRKREAETRETALTEVVEAQLERDMLSRRRGFLYWLQTLCLLLVGLQLAVGFALAAAMLYASRYDRELFHRLLGPVLPRVTYAELAQGLGNILTVSSEGLLPF
ncbi:uncharacterized protein O9250_013411 [Rhynochetos jubatus]